MKKTSAVGDSIVGYSEFSLECISKRLRMTKDAMDWDSARITSIIDQALQEDIGSGDITTQVLVPPNRSSHAVFIAKEEGVLAGLPLVSRVFKRLDPACQVRETFSDGASISTDFVICHVDGNTVAILSGERVALNFLQRLSGIATQTARYARLAGPFGISILDTRKTTPLLRNLEKYAVQTGGGKNHRIGLFDAVLVKDNHLKLEPDFSTIIRKFGERGITSDKIEIEVISPEMLQRAMDAGARWFLLDNMSPAMIQKCVQSKRENMYFEVSGGITYANFSSYLIPGVDAISIGGLTHSVKSLDISMEID